MCSPGVDCAALLPGHDARQGAVAESHCPGAPPAPVPQDIWTPFMYHPPHETLPPSLTLEFEHASLDTENTHINTPFRVALPSPCQDDPTAWWYATNIYNRDVD